MKRLAIAFLLTACTVQHDVPLEIAGLDRGNPAGFMCRAPSAMGGGPLLTEVVAPDLAVCSMACPMGACRTSAYVFDFVEMSGVPSCRAPTLVDWCSDPSRCRVVGRRCFDVDACVSSADSTVASVEAGLRAASDGVILDPAPDGVVLVRVIGSAQSCATIARAGVVREEVFGCAYSCPAQLDQVQGAVELDLDVIDAECGSLVYACSQFLTGEHPVMP